ncbi:MAG TPA: CopG family transcriptional regulator [Planctomycetota bacterium]|nr:CopG family transcriptional regulator [Planctomycetota bacterium]
MSTLERTQLLLEREQNQALTEMARRTGRSRSEIVREMLREQLAQKAREDKKAQVLDALAWLDRFCEEVKAKHGVITRDLVEEVREEADSYIDEILKGQK